MKTILITGVDGFIGKNLHELFLESNACRILAPSLNELDLTDDKAVKMFFYANTINYVVHCATVEMKDKTYVSNVCEQNLRMFFNIIRSKPDDCIVYSLCSGSVYDRNHWVPKMHESYFDQYVPSDGHSYSKYIINKYALLEQNIVILRLFGIFGKYEDYLYKFISNVIAKNLKRIPYVVYKNSYYDYLYVNDFFKIVLLLIEKKINTGIFNVTPTESISLIDICHIVNKVSGNSMPIDLMDLEIGNGYTGSNVELLEALGGFDFTSYDDSINELFEYYRNIEIDMSKLSEDRFLKYASNLYRK